MISPSKWVVYACLVCSAFGIVMDGGVGVGGCVVNDIKQMFEIRIRVKYKQVLIQIIFCLSVVGIGHELRSCATQN